MKLACTRAVRTWDSEQQRGMPRTKAQPVKKQRVSEEAALPLDDAALLAHAERVVQQLEANEVEQRVRVRVRVATCAPFHCSTSLHCSHCGRPEP